MSAPEKNGEDHEVLETLMLERLMHRMAEKGLDPSEVTHDMVFRKNKYLTALEPCEWLKLLEDSLLIAADCVGSLLGLRNSTFKSSPEGPPVAVCYLRTYILTVAQLNEVIAVLPKAKILFKNKIFARKSTIASFANSISIYLRYAGISRATNAWSRHVHDRRIIRGFSLMRILYFISDLFPASKDDVSNTFTLRYTYFGRGWGIYESIT